MLTDDIETVMIIARDAAGIAKFRQRSHFAPLELGSYFALCPINISLLRSGDLSHEPWKTYA
jgi:hypothetical protein